jgi:hypothetical protein
MAGHATVGFEQAVARARVRTERALLAAQPAVEGRVGGDERALVVLQHVADVAHRDAVAIEPGEVAPVARVGGQALGQAVPVDAGGEALFQLLAQVARASVPEEMPVERDVEDRRGIDRRVGAVHAARGLLAVVTRLCRLERQFLERIVAVDNGAITVSRTDD